MMTLVAALKKTPIRKGQIDVGNSSFILMTLVAQIIINRMSQHHLQNGHQDGLK